MKFTRTRIFLNKTFLVLIIHLIGCILSALCAGCATTGYLSDRSNDAADIFSVQIGYGGGAKARVGPLQIGLLVDIGLGGLRGGSLHGKNEFWPFYLDSPSKQDYLLGCFGIEVFDGGAKCNERGKSYGCNQIVIPILPNPESDPDFQQYEEDAKYVYNPWPYYTQIEAVAGLGINLRLGFNPGELLDFILGWTTIDIFNDDLDKRKRIEQASEPYKE